MSANQEARSRTSTGDHPPRMVVITGTDTGVGKTVVGCGLAGALRRRGVRVVAIKPIESGCDGSHDLEDGTRLWRASGQGQPERALLSLRQPVAPPVAADAEGVIVDFDHLMQRCRELGRGAQVVLVEGAGGLLSPLTWHHTTVDIAQALHAPALVVAANRLGVINHVELVLEVLHQRGLPTLGVVLSSDVGDASSSSNAAVLRRLRRGLRLYSLPRVADVDEAADNLGAVTDWLLADDRKREHG